MQNKITKFDELKNLVGDLDKLSPVVLDQYEKIISEYDIESQILFCQCLEGRGKVCNQKHKIGYVVQLKDNYYSIIGNQCVKKFDDTTQIRRDINLYNNEQRRLKKLENISLYVDDLEIYKEKLKQAKLTKMALDKSRESLLDSLGNEFEKLATCSANINITGFKKGMSKDKERGKIPFAIGSIKARNAICFGARYNDLDDAIKGFEKGLNNLVNLLNKIHNESYTPKESEINAYRIQLEKINEIERLLKDIQNDWNSFKGNNPEQIVFAYDKPYHLIKFLLGTNKQSAKEFCTEVENRFKKEHDLESISKTQMTLIRSSGFFG